MIVYLVLLSFWGLMAIIIQLNGAYKYNSNKLYLIVASISLFFIMALRSETVGTDILAYYFEYENASDYTFNLLRASELGYSYFNLIFSELGISFQVYLAVIAAIFIFAISKLYYIYSKNVLLSYYLHVTIGLFAMSMTGLRQTLAISLTLLAFIYLMRDRKILFFLFIGIAYFFHNSAITFLPVFLLSKIRINKKIGLIIFGLSCSMFLLRDWIASLFQYIVISNKYKNYLDIPHNVNPLVVLVNMAIPLACLLFYSYNKGNNEEGYNRAMSTLFLLSITNFIVHILSLNVSMITRISLYFMVYNTVLIPNVIQGIKRKEIRIIAILVSIFLPLIQFIISTPGSSYGIDNYKFYWK